MRRLIASTWNVIQALREKYTRDNPEPVKPSSNKEDSCDPPKPPQTPPKQFIAFGGRGQTLSGVGRIDGSGGGRQKRKAADKEIVEISDDEDGAAPPQKFAK